MIKIKPLFFLNKKKLVTVFILLIFLVGSISTIINIPTTKGNINNVTQLIFYDNFDNGVFTSWTTVYSYEVQLPSISNEDYHTPPNSAHFSLAEAGSKSYLQENLGKMNSYPDLCALTYVYFPVDSPPPETGDPEGQKVFSFNNIMVEVVRVAGIDRWAVRRDAANDTWVTLISNKQVSVGSWKSVELDVLRSNSSWTLYINDVNILSEGGILLYSDTSNYQLFRLGCENNGEAYAEFYCDDVAIATAHIGIEGLGGYIGQNTYTSINLAAQNALTCNVRKYNTYDCIQPQVSAFPYPYCWDSFFQTTGALKYNTTLAKENINAVLSTIDEYGYIPNAPSTDADQDLRTQPTTIGETVYQYYAVTNDISSVNTWYNKMDDYFEWCSENLDIYSVANRGIQYLYSPMTGRRSNDEYTGFFAAASTGMDNAPVYDDLAPLAYYTTYGGRYYIPQYSVLLSSWMCNYAGNMAILAQAIGNTSRITYYSAMYNNIKNAVNTNLWNEDNSRYEDKSWSNIFIEVNTIQTFAPMIAHIPDQDKMIDLYFMIIDANQYNTPNGIPTVALNDDSYYSTQPNYFFSGTHPYWRGGIWAPTTYMVIWGLLQYNYVNEAKAQMLKYLNMVEFESELPFAEYFKLDNNVIVAGSTLQNQGWTSAVTILMYNLYLQEGFTFPEQPYGDWVWNYTLTPTPQEADEFDYSETMVYQQDIESFVYEAVISQYDSPLGITGRYTVLTTPNSMDNSVAWTGSYTNISTGVVKNGEFSFTVFIPQTYFDVHKGIKIIFESQIDPTVLYQIYSFEFKKESVTPTDNGGLDGGGIDTVIPILTSIFGNIGIDIVFIVFGVICGLLTWKFALTGLIAGIGISTFLCTLAGLLSIWAVGLCIVLDITLIVLGSGLLNKHGNDKVE